jgi:hypothetical protein
LSGLFCLALFNITFSIAVEEEDDCESLSGTHVLAVAYYKLKFQEPESNSPTDKESNQEHPEFKAGVVATTRRILFPLEHENVVLNQMFVEMPFH